MSERSKAMPKQPGRTASAKTGHAAPETGAKAQAPAAGRGDERAAASQPAERRPAELAKQQISRKPQKPSRTAS